MPGVDMSPQAVTARLKLVSELRDLCLLLGTAKFESKSERKSLPKENRRQKNVKRPPKNK